jgi:cyclopropane fatty-acyl-phospholipid synthase-like methyltransferase
MDNSKIDIDIWEKTWSKMRVEIGYQQELIFKEIINHISFKNKSILELGSGMGRLSCLMKTKGEADCISLVDLSDKALQKARILFSGHQKISYIKEDALYYKSDKKYDIVFSSGTLEHFNEYERIILIKNHRKNSNKTVILVVPSDTIFNKRRMKKEKTIQKYGWQDPISCKQMAYYFQQAGLTVTENYRFLNSYGMPFISRGPIRKYIRPMVDGIKMISPILGGLVLTIGVKD